MMAELAIVPIKAKVRATNLKTAKDRQYASLSTSNFRRKLDQLISVSDFAPSLYLIAQEFLMCFIPKALYGGWLRRSFLTPVYELLLELNEYVGLYLAPPLVGLAAAPVFAKALKLPDFRLLGEPTYKLKDSIGRPITVGKLDPKSYVINQSLLAKTALGKVGIFALASILSIMAQIVAPAVRTLLIGKVTGTDNFYKISGLAVDANQVLDSSAAHNAAEQAKRNIALASWGSIFSLPSILMAVKLLAPALASGRSRLSRSLIQASKFLSMGERFGISKISMIGYLALSPWAYTSVGLNRAAALEDQTRLLLLTNPEVLFFKQLGTNFITQMCGLAFGCTGLLQSWGDYLREVKQGRRDPFDLNLVNDSHIINNPEVRLMKPARKASLLKAIHHYNKWGIYGLAVLMGLGMNWFNYNRTSKLHKLDSEGRDKQ